MLLHVKSRKKMKKRNWFLVLVQFQTGLCNQKARIWGLDRCCSSSNAFHSRIFFFLSFHLVWFGLSFIVLFFSYSIPFCWLLHWKNRKLLSTRTPHNKKKPLTDRNTISAYVWCMVHLQNEPFLSFSSFFRCRTHLHAYYIFRYNMCSCCSLLHLFRFIL